MSFLSALRLIILVYGGVVVDRDLIIGDDALLYIAQVMSVCLPRSSNVLKGLKLIFFLILKALKSLNFLHLFYLRS